MKKERERKGRGFREMKAALKRTREREKEREIT